MSESLPIVMLSIGLLALGLGLARGAMLRASGFVPRGRKSVETRSVASPTRAAAAAPVRTWPRAKQIGSGRHATEPGLAR